MTEEDILTIAESLENCSLRAEIMLTGAAGGIAALLQGLAGAAEI